MFSLVRTKDLEQLKTYEKRLIDVENAINRLNSELLSVTTDQKIIRDKVLRKIQFKKGSESEEESQNLKTESPLIPS